jgi:hypothetical protein
MNRLGKALVLVNLTISLIVLTWALILFVRPVDWGWKEARRLWSAAPEGKKEANERVPSKIDERVAAYKELRGVRGSVLARVPAAEKRVDELTGHFGYNHLKYAEEMDRLARDKKPIVIKGVTYNKDGSIATQANKIYGLPLLSEAVPGVDKSYASYLDELDARGKAMKKVAEALADILGKQEKLTAQLNGVRDKGGKVVEPGLYDLLEEQAQEQARLKAELDYLQPLWVYELYNAQLLRARRRGLEKRLIELGEDPSRVLQK